MNAPLLVMSVLDGLVGGGRKQSRRARRFLGGRGGSLWTNPATIMTAAGLAWGVYETLQKTRGGEGVGHEAGGAPTADEPAAGAQHADPPPVPGGGSQMDEAPLRLIRLAVSAAGADGVINDRERAAILQQAKAAGMAELVERELSQPKPLAEIVDGVSQPEDAATLYVMAFTILRADEQVTGSERIYLAQLAHLLHLDRQTVAALESDTGDRIDALGDQGQPGG